MPFRAMEQSLSEKCIDLEIKTKQLKELLANNEDDGQNLQSNSVEETVERLRQRLQLVHNTIDLVDTRSNASSNNLARQQMPRTQQNYQFNLYKYNPFSAERDVEFYKQQRSPIANSRFTRPPRAADKSLSPAFGEMYPNLKPASDNKDKSKVEINLHQSSPQPSLNFTAKAGFSRERSVSPLRLPTPTHAIEQQPVNTHVFERETSLSPSFKPRHADSFLQHKRNVSTNSNNSLLDCYATIESSKTSPNRINEGAEELSMTYYFNHSDSPTRNFNTRPLKGNSNTSPTILQSVKNCLNNNSKNESSNSIQDNLRDNNSIQDNVRDNNSIQDNVRDSNSIENNSIENNSIENGSIENGSIENGSIKNGSIGLKVSNVTTTAIVNENISKSQRPVVNNTESNSPKVTNEIKDKVQNYIKEKTGDLVLDYLYQRLELAEKALSLWENGKKAF